MEDVKALSEIEKEMDKIGIKNLGIEVIKELQNLCVELQASAEEMCDMWMAYVSQNGLVLDNPSPQLLDQMKRETLSRKKTTPRIKPYNPQNTTPRPTVNDNSPVRIHLEVGYVSTPESPSSSSIFEEAVVAPEMEFGGLGSSPSKLFGKRQNIGEVVASYGSEPGDWLSTGAPIHCMIHPTTSLNGPYSYMSQKLRDSALILSELIDDYSSQLASDVDHWDPVNLPNQNLVSVCGRICCDAQGKLNINSLLLEGSISSSSGQTVEMDISNLGSYAFFPGQIICGQGLNPEGKSLIVQNILQERPLQFSGKEVEFGTDPLDIMVACGPFTTTDCLSYEPLSQLMEHVVKRNPHLLILIGPFIEAKENVVVLLGLQSFENLFANFLQKLDDKLLSCKTKVVLVASQRDAICLPVYPTPPLNQRLKKSERILYAPDPCFLELGGLVLAATSTDVLLHLAKEEISHHAMTDRLGRVASYLLSQHSFYPLYPPSETINFDLEAFESHGRMSVTPHIMLVPSDMKCFVKDLYGCICVNPERLAKGQAGGTFSAIRVTPPKEKTALRSLAPYINVKVIRI